MTMTTSIALRSIKRFITRNISRIFYGRFRNYIAPPTTILHITTTQMKQAKKTQKFHKPLLYLLNKLTFKPVFL